MTARDLARILLRHPDLEVFVIADDLGRYEISEAVADRERKEPRRDPEPTGINISADWRRTV